MTDAPKDITSEDGQTKIPPRIDEVQLRYSVLQLALSGQVSSETTVQIAQQFYDFVTGTSQPGDEQQRWIRHGWKNGWDSALEEVQRQVRDGRLVEFLIEEGVRD